MVFKNYDKLKTRNTNFMCLKIVPDQFFSKVFKSAPRKRDRVTYKNAKFAISQNNYKKKEKNTFFFLNS